MSSRDGYAPARRVTHDRNVQRSGSYELSEYFDQHGWKLFGATQHGEPAAAEDATRVTRRLAVDRQAKRGHPLLARLGNGLACVLHPVTAFVNIDVVRLAVGQDQQKAT